MSSSHTRAAHGTHTDHGRPLTSTALTPFIAVHPAADAVAFYAEVFGATLVYSVDMPGANGEAQIAHAVMDFGLGRLELGEPNPAYHLASSPDGDDVVFSLAAYCTDVDAVVEAAIARGATLREPPADFVSGDRFASIRDPFGVRWSVMTRVEDLSDEESARRVAGWAASLG